MKTLNSADFMKIFHSCCKNGKINDKLFEELLSTYWPYNLVFKGDLRKKK